MPTSPVPEGRRLKRIASRKRASLIINLERNQTRIPCLVVDTTERGFRLHGNFRLRRGQAVELILDEDPLSAVRCNVVWIGKPGSKQDGEIGLEVVSIPRP
jgi:PilZ domain-containing protein